MTDKPRVRWRVTWFWGSVQVERSDGMRLQAIDLMGPNFFRPMLSENEIAAWAREAQAQ